MSDNWKLFLFSLTVIPVPQNTLITIQGKNFGALRALQLYGDTCANSPLRACKQVLRSGVLLSYKTLQVFKSDSRNLPCDIF